MPRIVPKSRMTPGGYGSTSAPKRKQRAEGEKSPRKTKKSKKSKKKRAKRRAIQALTEYLPDNWARLRAFGYLADNLMGVRPGPRPCKDPKIPPDGAGGNPPPSP